MAHSAGAEVDKILGTYNSNPITGDDVQVLSDVDIEEHLSGDILGESLSDEVRKLRQSIRELPHQIRDDIRKVLVDFEVKPVTLSRKGSKNLLLPATLASNQPIQPEPESITDTPLGSPQPTGVLPFQRRMVRSYTAGEAGKELVNDLRLPLTLVKPLEARETSKNDDTSSFAPSNPDSQVPIRRPSGSIAVNNQKDDQDGRFVEMNGNGFTPALQVIPSDSAIPTVMDEEGRARRRNVQDVVHSIVLSTTFDYLSASMVIINAITIGMQTDYMARNLTDKPSIAYRFVDIIFCIIFSTELLLRVVAFGHKFFHLPDGKWNAFDLILVSLQLVDEILRTVVHDQTNGMNFSFLRIFRILRLVRIMRVIRILRLIGELRTIVSSIVGSMQSLMWTIILLFMFVYVFAVYLTQLVLDYRVSKDSVDNSLDETLAYYYGTLPRSVLSLYQAISGGVDWDELTHPLMEQLSVFLALVLCIYTAFCLLALMNVVTGVFVEAALESAKKDRASYMLTHVKELFRRADPDNTGTLNWDRFQGCLDEEFMHEFFRAIDVDRSEARSVFALLDADDSGEIDLEEFLNGCLALHGPAKSIHLATLVYETRIGSRFHSAHMAHVEQLLGHLLDGILKANEGPRPQPPVDAELGRRRSFSEQPGLEIVSYLGASNSVDFEVQSRRAYRDSVDMIRRMDTRSSRKNSLDSENRALEPASPKLPGLVPDLPP